MARTPGRLKAGLQAFPIGKVASGRHADVRVGTARRKQIAFQKFNAQSLRPIKTF
jgi:hypothetical protein